MPFTPPPVPDPYPAEGHLTLKQYGERAGLSHVAIFNRIKEGKLDGCYYKDNLGRINIDPEKADEALANPSIKEQMNRKITSRKGFDGTPRKSDQEIEEDNQKKMDGAHTYTKARTGVEIIKLQRAQIELEELKGSLVQVEQVRKEQFLMARLLRDQMMSIPDRIAAILSTMGDERKIHAMLTSEIREALKQTDVKAREELAKNA